MNCRICKKEINEGTICADCLEKTDQELLTIEERKQKNDIIDEKERKGCLLYIAIAIIGLILTFLGAAIIGIPLILIAVVISLRETSTGSTCAACQRKGTTQYVSKQLVSTRPTTMRVTRTIEKVRNEGSYSPVRIPEKYEIEDYVPAIEKTYQLTYKCNKCGYLSYKTETETVQK